MTSDAFEIPAQSMQDLPAITDDFPSRVFLLRFSTGAYATCCVVQDNLYGIVCFESENEAFRFGEHILAANDDEILQLPLNTAIEVARERQYTVPYLRCLFLLNANMQMPKATFWL